MCSHGQEPDCGVREAVEAGRIPRSRYENYWKLRSEAIEATER
jgi:ribosome biogenesis GTPase